MSTQALMVHFYRGMLEEGRTAADALRQAKRAMLEGAHAHAYHWAGFVLWGLSD